MRSVCVMSAHVRSVCVMSVCVMSACVRSAHVRSACVMSVPSQGREIKLSLVIFGSGHALPDDCVPEVAGLKPIIASEGNV